MLHGARMLQGSRRLEAANPPQFAFEYHYSIGESTQHPGNLVVVPSRVLIVPLDDGPPQQPPKLTVATVRARVLRPSHSHHYHTTHRPTAAAMAHRGPPPSTDRDTIIRGWVARIARDFDAHDLEPVPLADQTGFDIDGMDPVELCGEFAIRAVQALRRPDAGGVARHIPSFLTALLQASVHLNLAYRDSREAHLNEAGRAAAADGPDGGGDAEDEAALDQPPALVRAPSVALPSLAGASEPMQA